ncbi:hypothetical protein A2767_03780 [Candidatus Roizmanbacteria bacterium RIFCSPHIGHO2_01_FULL_35_10]|uniref:Antitoxin n=1 Tax=Candidatus Roizmanbacteria bacterium RIFCSPLOWO2_01_FULL_35_13 TaxID=1802055 RepID=A0A1F7IA45_9BACT|nr:MAG: hypothetical protein A2767_03780 [Candidatus Roizmanbacteria bacterium RIFCSPHIGHO2_01_FULL_35_10]OGK40244.1 MAG: hypothetical protein A3A74_07095 [Candidatus Roizmanbacteria bacterium RIFCSPLOWO2_01_FULL_35_13]
MFNTVSARQLQRGYKKVLEKANKLKKPLVVIANNKPLGAIIGLDLLEELELDSVLKEAMTEYKAGKTKKISTEKELEDDLKELEKYV